MFNVIYFYIPFSFPFPVPTGKRLKEQETKHSRHTGTPEAVCFIPPMFWHMIIVSAPSKVRIYVMKF